MCVCVCVCVCVSYDRHPTKWKAELGVFQAQVYVCLYVSRYGCASLCVCVSMGMHLTVYVSPMIASLPNGKLN